MTTRRQKILDMHEAHPDWSVNRIAERLNYTWYIVNCALEDAGIVLADARRRRGGPVEIPAWVPRALHDRYLETASRAGEEAAASEARHMKREMA